MLLAFLLLFNLGTPTFNLDLLQVRQVDLKSFLASGARKVYVTGRFNKIT